MGADMPFVLREQDRDEGTFCLVGESYVHGVMYGERLRGSKGKAKEKALTEVFKLC